MKTEYTFTRETYLLLQKRRLVFYAILALFGIVGIIVFAILYPKTDYNKYLIFLFAPSLAFAIIGVLYDVMIGVMIFKLKDVAVKFTYEFKEEFLLAKSYDQGKLTSDNTVYYDRIMKYKETKKAFFLYLPNKKVLPLSSEDTKLEEIKKIIHIDDIPKKKI